jgi:hypothetical protein
LRKQENCRAKKVDEEKLIDGESSLAFLALSCSLEENHLSSAL